MSKLENERLGGGITKFKENLLAKGIYHQYFLLPKVLYSDTSLSMEVIQQ